MKTTITSLSNPRITAIRKLLEAKHRRQAGLFVAEGLRLVTQALQSQAAVRELIYCPELLVSAVGQNQLMVAEARGIDLLEVTPAVFNSFSRKDTPQGLAALIEQRWGELSETQPSAGSIWVGLQAVQNPGNLGTILRTCDAVAASGLILLDDSTDPYDPAAVKASMGSIFTVPVIKSNLNALTAWLANNPGIHRIGTSDKASIEHFQTDYPLPCLILMGSERQGLPDEYIRLCEKLVRIPMEGSCDSLNLAVSTGIVLYQVYVNKKAGAE